MQLTSATVNYIAIRSHDGQVEIYTYLLTYLV